MKDQDRTDLANLCGGAAVEKFGVELERVLENIENPNTDPKAKRVVTLKFTFQPKEDRTSILTSIVAESKLAPEAATPTIIFPAIEGNGKRYAHEHRPHRQDDLGELTGYNKVTLLSRKEKGND